MKKIMLLIMLHGMLAISLTSCVGSMYPITENRENTIFKNELLGSWQETGSSESYIIEKAEGEMYRIKIVEKNPDKMIADTNYFLATMVNLDGKYYLDCITDTDNISFRGSNEFSQTGLLICHFIFKVYSLEKNSIEIGGIDTEVLLSLLKQKKISLKHEMIEKDYLVLLEKPASFQKKLSALEKFPTVFHKERLTRID